MNSKQQTPIARFGLRALLAIASGFSFVFWIFGWLFQNDSEWPLLAMVLLWGIGSLAGILACGRHPGRTLLGSILGGTVTVALFLVGFACVRNVPWVEMSQWVAIAAGASSILAAIVDILRDGITVPKFDKEAVSFESQTTEPTDAP